MFRLLRYFFITSFVSIIVAAVVLGLFYRTIAVRSVIEMGEVNNASVTRALANSLEPELWPYLATAESLSTVQLQSHPGKKEFSTEVVAHLKGLSVVKVKLYE